MGDPAVSTAGGHTGATFVMGTPQGRCATRNLVNPFLSLPLYIVTPINVNNLQSVLKNYPHTDVVNFILEGFKMGLDIGFRATFSDNDTRPRNLLSARDNKDRVSSAIAKEVSRGHTAGPFVQPPFTHTH